MTSESGRSKTEWRPLSSVKCKLFKDEAYIIYVNSQIKDETKLGRLMHDFSCTNAKDMHNKVLADRVRYFKEDERGERSGDYVS